MYELTPALFSYFSFFLFFSARIFMYMFLAGLGLLVVVGLHQLLESRKVIMNEQLANHTEWLQY